MHLKIHLYNTCALIQGYLIAFPDIVCVLIYHGSKYVFHYYQDPLSCSSIIVCVCACMCVCMRMCIHFNLIKYCGIPNIVMNS